MSDPEADFLDLRTKILERIQEQSDNFESILASILHYLRPRQAIEDNLRYFIDDYATLSTHFGAFTALFDLLEQLPGGRQMLKDRGFFRQRERCMTTLDSLDRIIHKLLKGSPQFYKPSVHRY